MTSPSTIVTLVHGSLHFDVMFFGVARTAKRFQPFGIFSRIKSQLFDGPSVTVDVMNDFGRLATTGAKTVSLCQDHISAHPEMLLFSSLFDFGPENRIVSFGGIPISACLLESIPVLRVVNSHILANIFRIIGFARHDGAPGKVFRFLEYYIRKHDKCQDEDIVQSWQRCQVPDCFKGSSAILNTLLRAINERKFRNGTTDLDLPLRLLIGASNEVPPPENMKELHAMFDRFLIRHEIKPALSKAGRHRLLGLPKAGKSVQRDHTPVLSTFLTLAELDAASEAALALVWSDDAEEALDKILDELQGQAIIPTQRRQWKSVRAAQAYAWLSGAAQVDVEHLEILQDILWDDPTQVKTARDIVGKIANPIGMEVNRLISDMDEIISKIDPNDMISEGHAVRKLGEVGQKFKELAPKSKKAQAGQDAVIKEIRRIRLGRFDVLDG